MPPNFTVTKPKSQQFTGPATPGGPPATTFTSRAVGRRFAAGGNLVLDQGANRAVVIGYLYRGNHVVQVNPLSFTQGGTWTLTFDVPPTAPVGRWFLSLLMIQINSGGGQVLKRRVVLTLYVFD